ncbi:MAG: hypothetical protein JNK82_45315 [Myxococcaceae bacterium]|nr:hypothetical protein [Myxococcaceae bacterium]
MRLPILVIVFLAFTGWSFTVVASHGLFGFLTLAAREPWAMQMLIDLGISLFIAWMWLKHDAKAQGITAWPYMLGTALGGSPVVLLYLIHRELKKRGTQSLRTTSA